MRTGSAYELFMYSKQKGNIAFSSVILELQKQRFNVFTESGDLSRVDPIAERDCKLAKIQVKYSKDEEGNMILNLVKSGPNGYRYTYSENDVDWFAVYSLSTGKIAWISSKEACIQKRRVTFRLEKPRNNQTVGIHLIEDYDINRFLRDFTQDTDTPFGEDKVQTTTK